MKVTLDQKNYRITLDNEAIKAIRFCTGYNPDLRIKLNGLNKSSLWYWIDENRFGVLGWAAGCMKPSPTSNDWDKYERMLNDVVRQIAGC